MKFKISFLAVLIVGLVFGFAGSSHAQLVLGAGVDDATLAMAANSTGNVIGTFKVTQVANSTQINTFTLTVAAATLTAAEIARVAIYEDVNNNGSYDSTDKLIKATTTLADFTLMLGAGLVLNPDPDDTFATLEVKDYIVVLDLKKTVVDTRNIDVTVALVDEDAVLSIPNTLNLGNADAVAIAATRIDWNAAAINQVLLADAGAKQLGIDGESIYSAVDDYGNLDTGYAGAVTVTAETMAGAANGAITITTTTAFPALAAGLADVYAATGADDVMLAAAAATHDVILLATQANISGSTSVNMTADGKYPGAAVLLSTIHGAEFYDVDLNGKLDHVTIWLNKPVAIGATPASAFTVAGHTVIGEAFNNVDIGSFGAAAATGQIRSAGMYGITLEFNETGYDTDDKPQVTYDNTTGKISADFNTVVLTLTDDLTTEIAVGDYVVAENGAGGLVIALNLGGGAGADVITVLYPNTAFSATLGDTGLQLARVYDSGTADVTTIVTTTGVAAPTSLVTAAGTALGSITAASMTEVDKARPVLLSVTTVDNGVAGGVANNHKVDGVEIVFSEVVDGVTVATGAEATAGDVGGNQGSSIALGTKLADGTTDNPLIVTTAGVPSTLDYTTFTIPITEGAFRNGDLIPQVLFNQLDAGATVFDIRDNARDLLNVLDVNELIVTKAARILDLAADATVIDGVSAAVISVVTNDTGTANGKLDKFTVEYTEPMGLGHEGVTFVDASGTFGPYTAINATAVTNKIISYAVAELGTSTTIFDTESTPAFAYTGSGTAVDANGTQVASWVTQDTATLDNASPVVVSVIYQDNHTDEDYGGVTAYESAVPNGRVDTGIFEFSEKVITDAYKADATVANLDAAVAQLKFAHTTNADYMVQFTASSATVGALEPAPTWVDVATGDTKTTITINFKEKPHNDANMTNGGDTGLAIKAEYVHGAVDDNLFKDDVVYNIVDGFTAGAITDEAAPVVVDGLIHTADALKDWHTAGVGNWFANIWTVDTDGVSTIGSDDTANGDGFIDGFTLYFSEDVYVASATPLGLVDAFTVDNGANSDIVIDVGIDGNGDGLVDVDADGVATTVDTDDVKGGNTTFTLLGSSNEDKDAWDTGTSPTLAFDAGIEIYDNAATGGTNAVLDAGDNAMIAFGAQLAYDGAKPVPAMAVAGVDTDNINVTWSELIYTTQGALDGGTGVFNAVDNDFSAFDGDEMFDYEDIVVGTVTDVEDGGTLAVANNLMSVQANAIFEIADVEADLIWFLGTSLVYDYPAILVDIYDDCFAATASVTLTGFATGRNNVNDLTSRAAVAVVLGTDLKIIIDDRIAPWITAAVTVDADGNGLVDHIRFTLSEMINPETLTGFSAYDELSADVSATWTLEGYTGTTKWNLFKNNADGIAAAFAVGEPIFTDSQVNSANYVLYLRIDEGGLPVVVSHGMGDTGYVGAFTVTTPELSDNKPNVLDVASDEPDAVNSGENVVDEAAPVLMAAETTSTTTMDAWFSEEVDADTVMPADFDWTLCNVGGGYEVNAVCVGQAATGVVQLKVVGANAWDANMAGRLLVDNGDAAVGIDDLAVDSAGDDAVNTTILANGNAYDAAVYYQAADDPTDPGAVWPAVWDVVKNTGFIKNYIDITVGFTGGGVGGPVGAPADLVLTDVPDDNGHWMFATFTVSADHLTRVKSYQFYREVDFGTEAVPDLKWVYSSVVPAGMVTDGKMVCLVPSVVDGLARWAVVASTGDAVTDPVAFKEAGIPVAQLVEGAAEKAAEGISLSEMAITVVPSGSIDNTAPSPIVTWAVDDNAGADAGIIISWTAPDDHTAVTTEIMGVEFYGVDGYEVYRKEQGAEVFELIDTAAPLSTSYIDAVEDGITVYEYYVVAVDSNTDHDQTTGSLLAMAFVGGADFSSDGVVGLGDLVLFGSQWGINTGEVGWISAFDLNADGSVGLGDLVLLGDAWTVAGKVAKALPTTNDVALTMDAEYDGSSSIYYVNINVSEADGFNGVGFTMSYDAEALELVEDGIVGLGVINVTRETEAGMLDINSYFMDDEFNGSITVTFKSRGMNKDLDFELANPSVSIDNVISAVGDVALTVEAIPAVYSLSQNYPNPFNPTTTILYSIPQSGHVELVIYNMAGQKVRTLVNETQSASFKKVVWDGRNEMGETVGAGLYFYKLVSGNYSKIQKMALIK